jgi:hypothetical protein
VSTTGETSDVGIVPDGASLVFNRLVVDWYTLTETTNVASGALEGDHETSTALLGSANLDDGGSSVASL